jgi:hypothetical protein
VADRLWSGWYDAVLPEVPGCAIAVADFAIKRAAIEFCVESCAWRKAVPAIDSVASTGEYTFPAVATGVMVAKLLEARWIGTKLYNQRPDELAELFGPTDWRALTPATPRYFVQETPNAVRLVPTPDVSTVGAINGLWAAVRPTDTATGIDDAVASENFDAIKDGALRNLFASSNKPYTNPQLAGVYALLFSSAIGNAAFRAFRGGKGAPRTMTSYR